MNHMNLLFEINPLAKIFHISNLDVLIRQMKNALAEFEEKAPHRTDYIKCTNEGIETLYGVKVWIEHLYAAYEAAGGENVRSGIINLKLLADRNKFEQEADKLIKTLEFNLNS